MPQFILDAPIVLSDSTTEVQVAKTGSFRDSRFGAFSITEKSYDDWMANFTRLSVANGRLGVPIDLDHSPEKRGETKAVGWIKSLRKAGSALMATVEWTPQGKQLVEDKQYAYLSPTFGDKTVEGKAVGEMLVGVALTNRPYLQMPTVSMCEDDVEAEDGDGMIVLSVSEPVADPRRVQLGEVRSDTPGQMPILDDIKGALALSDDADDAAVLAAVAALKDTPAAKTLDELATEAGKIVMDGDSFKTLSENALAGAAAAKTLSELRFKTAFDKACDEGSAVPAQEDNLKALYAVDADTTITLIESFEPKVNVTARGERGTTAERSEVTLGEDLERNETVEADDLKIFQRAITLEAEGMDYAEAIVKATEELAHNGV